MIYSPIPLPSVNRRPAICPVPNRVRQGGGRTRQGARTVLALGYTASGQQVLIFGTDLGKKICIMLSDGPADQVAVGRRTHNTEQVSPVGKEGIRGPPQPRSSAYGALCCCGRWPGKRLGYGEWFYVCTSLAAHGGVEEGACVCVCRRATCTYTHRACWSYTWLPGCRLSQEQKNPQKMGKYPAHSP